jgi:hypothetical protein
VFIHVATIILGAKMGSPVLAKWLSFLVLAHENSWSQRYAERLGKSANRECASLRKNRADSHARTPWKQLAL